MDYHFGTTFEGVKSNELSTYIMNSEFLDKFEQSILRKYSKMHSPDNSSRKEILKLIENKLSDKNLERNSKANDFRRILIELYQKLRREVKGLE